MKHLFYFICFSVLLISCQGSQNDYEWEDDYGDFTDEAVTTNSVFELEYIDKGLSCEDYYATLEGYNVKNHVTYGERLYFNMDNITGFELIDGDLTADMMFLFLSEEGDTLEFTDYGDIDPLEVHYSHPDEAIDLNLNSNMIDPLFSGDSYIYKAGFRDVNSGNSLEIQTTVKMVKNANIVQDREGLKCGDAYIYNAEENDFITDNYVHRDITYEFGFHGLRGFTEIDGNVELGMSVIIYDEYDNISSDSGDLYEEDGWFTAASVFNELGSTFTIYESYDDEFVSVYVSVWDKNSERSITIHSDFWLYE